MAITAEDFQAVLTTLTQLLPMQRQLDAAALVMAWDTWPRAAKAEVTASMLQFAAVQRQLDPAPPREVALHMALLRYLFPLEGDRPVVERGLRHDLAERMAQPDRFHDPAPARQEQAPPQRPRLPGNGGFWHPSQMSQQQRRAHVERVALTAERWIACGVDQRSWGAEHLLQGAAWFKRALQGFWLLEADDGGIARAWVTRNPGWAQELIAEALTVEVPVLPTEGVLAGFIGGGREVERW